MIPTLYGIRNCDTVRKAIGWLNDRAQPFVFHDFKTAGLDRATLQGWVTEHGWEVVLNRKGTTFRALDETNKTDLTADRAIALMLAHPSMVKRPVLDLGERTLVGFDPAVYAHAFDA